MSSSAKLYKLLGEEQYLEFFPMLKDPEKRMEQDEIWKKILNLYDKYGQKFEAH